PLPTGAGRAGLTLLCLHRKYGCLPTVVSVDSMSFATGPSDHTKRQAHDRKNVRKNVRQDPRQSPHRRLRLPGHTAHRAAGAGGKGLFRDRAVQKAEQAFKEMKPKAVILSG